jgi:hypothetical protein
LRYQSGLEIPNSTAATGESRSDTLGVPIIPRLPDRCTSAYVILHTFTVCGQSHWAALDVIWSWTRSGTAEYWRRRGCFFSCPFSYASSSLLTSDCGIAVDQSFSGLGCRGQIAMLNATSIGPRVCRCKRLQHLRESWFSSAVSVAVDVLRIPSNGSSTSKSRPAELGVDEYIQGLML